MTAAMITRTIRQMSLTMRERLKRRWVNLSIPLALGGVLGVIGPFGTYALLPWQFRVPYWITVFSINWLMADGIIRRLERVFECGRTTSGLFVPLAGALIAAAPATGIVTLANAISGIGWPERLPRLAGQVLFLLVVVSIATFQWRRILNRPGTGTGSSAESSAGTTDDVDGAKRSDDPGLERFMARLSGAPRGSPQFLEMQDHYLIVHFETSSEIILCRMEDAACELDRLGRRVHRSWWVAEHAIEAVERDSGRIWLRLVDGTRIPVGRSFRQSLREARWL